MTPAAALALLLAVAAPAAPSGGSEPSADVVHLRDGSELTGRVLLRDWDGVLLRQGSRERRIPSEEIRVIDAREDRLATMLDHYRVLGDGDVRSMVDLASVCAARGLPGEAGLFYLRALEVDPTDERAHEALGHRRRGEAWTVHHSGRWIRWDERVELARHWNDAWEIETSHWSLRSNARLEHVLAAALDLERLYLHFYERFAEELGLLHVSDRLVAHLHGDAGSFPSIGHGRKAYYDSGPRRLVVDASEGFSRPAILHEATHEIFELGAADRRAERVAIPSWLSEGLAEYITYSAGGPPGRAWFRPGHVATMHAWRHATAEEPVGLTRLLALEAGDFLTSEDAQLYYAQSWTLVHLCLHDIDGRYREGFLDYLRDVRAGKGSPAAFRERVVAGDGGFEETWLAHAKRMAGGR